MSILRSSARHSSAFRRSSEMSLREALLDARRGTVTHRATMVDGVPKFSKPRRKFDFLGCVTKTFTDVFGLEK